MNPDIRPQDDLFGHVNGRWLDETEIPSDRSSWGPFVQLADIAEEQVRAIIEELAAGRPPTSSPRTPARSATSSPPSWTRTRIEKLGLRPVRPLIDAVDGLRDVRDLAAFLGEFERIGGHGLFGSYVDTDDRNSDRYLFHIVQGGLGLPDESYYRDDKFAEVREKYVAYLDRAARAGRARRPGRGGADDPRHRHQARGGPLGARRDPRRPEDLQPDHGRASSGALPGVRLGRLRHQPRRRRRDRRGVLRPAAVVPRAPVDGPRRGADRGLEAVDALPRPALRRAVPHRRLRRGELRLLRPHPQRHPRAARPLEARGLAGRGRDRRGRRQGVRRAATSRRRPRR